MEPTQTVIARLSAGLLRRANSLVAQDSAYTSLSELVSVALENQLALEGDDLDPKDLGSDPGPDPLLSLPAARPADLAEAPDTETPLAPFTNRLFPVMLACRVLANLSPNTRLPEYQRLAASAARNVGLRLREEDALAGRRGLARRWIALPVGNKGDATLGRFIHHFMITVTRSGHTAGPLAALGLATLVDNDVPLLTTAGWQLAQSANPVLDGDAPLESTLSSEERAIFAARIARNQGERSAIAEFTSIVAEQRGRQDAVDAALRPSHGWTKEQAAAHRAGLVGRLHDLGLAEVDGEGPPARIRLSDEVRRLVEGER